jgi:hypothetical protein
MCAKANKQLRAALGNIYIVAPDIIVTREPEEDETINFKSVIVDDHTANLASLRKKNFELPLLHASISCKWTVRSDRSQNSRSEALSLIRNRTGHLPHCILVLGEPLPSRIASIALGTGDLDCVYHFALPELVAAVNDSNNTEARDLLETLILGKRLKDISDLPLDLAV